MSIDRCLIHDRQNCKDVMCEASCDAPHYKRLTTILYRSLERLSLAIENCAKIGFEESKPVTNEQHAVIWQYLNEAQKDAKLKLKHFKVMHGISEEEMLDFLRGLGYIIQVREGL